MSDTTWVSAGLVCLLAAFASQSTCTPVNTSHSPANEDSQLLAELALGQPNSDLFIEVLSSPHACRIKVDGRTLFYREKSDPPSSSVDISDWQYALNGMYVISVHPATGQKTGESFAQGFAPNAAYAAMEEFVTHVQPGRLVVFCVLAEAALSLDRQAVELFTAVNSSYAPDLQSRSMFAMVAVRDGPVLAEGYVVNLDAVLRATTGDFRVSAHARRAPATSGCLRGRRAEFCARHDGYRSLCDCPAPAWLQLSPRPLERGGLFPYPIVIIASSRPHYLLRCLASLLANRGLDRQKVVVFVDGDYPEVRAMLRILKVRLHEHVLELPSMGSAGAGSRIGAIYRYTIETAFNLFPDADKVVLLEEDLEVSPDFVSFFDQTHHLLDVDPSLYCVSAWNDHGYNHTVGDPAQLYRVGFLPGLGWMLRRSFFFEEVVPKWPSAWKDFDWDVMLRLAQFRKGRDCIIPDVPRTYHFGFIGQHVNAGMQFKLYYDHALNRVPDVQLRDVDSMVYHKYEGLLMEEIKNAVMLDGSMYSNDSACDGVFPQAPTNKTYIIFITMEHVDDHVAWEKLATCLNLWDLDVRGDHRGLWRFWYRGNPILVLGVPFAELSTFAVHEHGEAVILGGRRTARQRKLGRWPPGRHRDMPSDRYSRLRLSAAAVEKAELEFVIT